MASFVGLADHQIALIDAGNKLLTPPSSTQELLTLLNETESLLRDVGQDQPLSMQHALIPSKNALVSGHLLTHPDSDVRVSLASCLTEITRITSPNAPYTDDQMKEIFRLTVEAFEKLADASSSRSYVKAEYVLDTVSRLNSCLVMLDLECDDLILQMFRIFLKTIRFDHPGVVRSSMERIMVTVIDETDQVSNDLLDTLLTSVKKENQNVSPMAWSLAEKVLSRCGSKLQPYIMKALKSTRTSLDLYSQVVSTICHTVFETPKVHNEEKLGSKKPAREGRISKNDKVRKGNSVKQVESEGIAGEKDLKITRKRGRKPNSLMNPEEGYDITWLSGKRDSLKTCSNKKVRGSSSLGKVAAKKTPPALSGSVKRRRVSSTGASDDDSDSLEEEEANQESYEDERKVRNSSKKKKKPVSETKARGKKSSAKTDTKKKSYTNEFVEGLVGQRVNIWWPLDKTFYEGEIKSYCSSKKMHVILYTDGVREELNLTKERWEFLEDLSSDSEDTEDDLPDSTPLLDIIKKSKNVAVSGKGGSKAGVVSEKTREGKRREEQEVSEDEDSQSEDEYYNSEKQEPFENKSAESLKMAEAKEEEEKQDPNSETESEGEGSESEEEPKWRETEDTEDDEAEEVDEKVRSTSLGDTEKDTDE
ncbi:unnamed protein product [Eruca vesicaria subsp. sativa]|uniref:Uncharacterized protein n=1 Tax=Eruca vesicaria subsp. sativa TaxID=29727 RepID=A0ABC8KE99_ERUVS|nr:unnamed protein product [Eruca vesicaria subsp. sativa]